MDNNHRQRSIYIIAKTVRCSLAEAAEMLEYFEELTDQLAAEGYSVVSISEAGGTIH